MYLKNASIEPHFLAVEEENLLKEWRKSVPGFISDGCVDPEKYAKAPVKLLFLLKEVNGGKDWDLRKFLKEEGGRAQTWDAVARWVEGLFNLGEDFLWTNLSDPKKSEFLRKNNLPQICAVNVKKTAGTYVTDPAALQQFVEENRSFLKRQIKLYQADIIILCGTEHQYFKAVEQKPSRNMTKHGVQYYIEDDGTVVISFSHPAARVDPCFLYYGLIDAVKEIVTKQ